MVETGDIQDDDDDQLSEITTETEKRLAKKEKELKEA